MPVFKKLGATKTWAHFFFLIENAKSDFRNYPNYSKDKHTEILEVIILRNLTKINIVFKHVKTLVKVYSKNYRTKLDQILSALVF